jgi:hypothetical protein
MHFLWKLGWCSTILDRLFKWFFSFFFFLNQILCIDLVLLALGTDACAFCLFLSLSLSFISCGFFSLSLSPALEVSCKLREGSLGSGNQPGVE